MTTSATINITYKKTSNFVYQTILITPSKRSHTRYYLMEKYEVGRQVDKMLDQLYLGDGKNIFFRDKQKFRNQITIKYEIITDTPLNLEEKKIHVQAEVPKHDGCVFCVHYRPSKRGKSKCAYYRKFLEREKIFCVDFFEKEE